MLTTQTWDGGGTTLPLARGPSVHVHRGSPGCSDGMDLPDIPRAYGHGASEQMHLPGLMRAQPGLSRPPRAKFLGSAAPWLMGTG